MNKDEQIGKRIKLSREREGLTQKELGEAIGRTESAIRKYEKGLIEVPVSILEKISLALHTDISFIMGLNDTIKINEIIKELDKINYEIMVNNQDQYELSKTLKELESKEISEDKKVELLNKVNKFLKNRENTNLRDKLLKQFYTLNEKGKDKAIESIELLTKVPEYKNTKEGD